MRCVGGARREVYEEGPRWREQSLLPHPIDGAIRHVGHEVVTLFGRRRRIDHVGPFVDRWIPLVSLTSYKPIEIFKPRTRGPVIEWPHRTRFPDRHFVALAELRCGVAVQPENLGDSRRRIRPARRVCGRCDLSDAAHADDVMVATAEKRSAGWRAQRSRMKTRVAQSICRKPVGSRCLTRSTERDGRAEPNIIQQHDQHVGRPFRWPQLFDRRKLRIRVLRVVRDKAGIRLGRE